jgi:hypothetical protein
MCELRDFDLPESFINRVRAGAALSDESAALVKDIAEQTGLPADAITTALTEEGISAYRLKGILF